MTIPESLIATLIEKTRELREATITENTEEIKRVGDFLDSTHNRLVRNYGAPMATAVFRSVKGAVARDAEFSPANRG